MNRAGIKHGDLVLVRQQQTAKDGDRVVALIDENATIKRFRRNKTVIILEPVSKNKKHKPIILERDFRIQGIAIKIISTTLI